MKVTAVCLGPIGTQNTELKKEKNGKFSIATDGDTIDITEEKSHKTETGWSSKETQIKINHEDKFGKSLQGVIFKGDSISAGGTVGKEPMCEMKENSGSMTPSLQCSCLENPTNRGAWQAGYIVHKVTESDTTEHVLQNASISGSQSPIQ